MLLHHINIKLDNAAIIKTCKDIVGTDLWKNQYKPEDELCGPLTFHSNMLAFDHPHCNPHTWPEFEPLVNLLPSLLDVSRIKLSWFNIMLPGGFGGAHTHGITDSKEIVEKYVAVYYPYSDETTPPIEFFVDGAWKSVYLKTGDFIVFPKALLHRVPLNISTRERVSVAFNI